MRPVAVGIWPFDAEPKAPAYLPQCWSAALNEQLIKECQRNGPMCSPASVATLLDLDYCPGECDGAGKASGPSTTTMVLGVATVAVAIALVMRKR